MAENSLEGSKKISKELIEQINQLMNEFEKQELDYVLIVGSRVDQDQKVLSEGLVVCRNDSPVPILGGITLSALEKILPLRRYVEDFMMKITTAFESHIKHEFHENNNNNNFYN